MGWMASRSTHHVLVSIPRTLSLTALEASSGDDIITNPVPRFLPASSLRICRQQSDGRDLPACMVG